MFRVVLAALAIVLLLASCGGGGTDTTVNSKLASNVTIVGLLVGQDLDVGYVSITDSGDTLTVTYVVEAADWYLKQTHLAVGDSLDDIPQKNGNPIPGQFPYHTDYSLADMVTTDTYVIDITGLGDPLYVAAHAKLVNLSDGNATELHFNEGFEYPTLPSPLGLRDGNPIGGTGSSDWDVFLSDDIPDWNVVWTRT